MSLLKRNKKFKVKVLELNSTEGYSVAEIWDASEEYLPDFTPAWLYELLDSLLGDYGELQESVFECDSMFLEALKNHPNCKEFIEG